MANAAIEFMGIPPEELEELKKTFNEMDSDRSGFVDMTEFFTFVQIQRTPIADSIFYFLDANFNEQITFGTFLRTASDAGSRARARAKEGDAQGARTCRARRFLAIALALALTRTQSPCRARSLTRVRCVPRPPARPPARTPARRPAPSACSAARRW